MKYLEVDFSVVVGEFVVMKKSRQIRRDAGGAIFAFALRKVLTEKKSLLKTRANWAKLAGLPYGVVSAAFNGGKIPSGTLEALAAAAGMEAGEMIQAAMRDSAADDIALDAESFGRRLRALSLRQGLTDTELAGRLGISTTRYGHYARGRNEPGLAMLHALCGALDLSPNDLLGYGADQAASRRKGARPAAAALD
ncbi:MAG: helix-turn-helix transcriptional regulator [Alphaproteobacteria bacterium]|nr:helix-turn-helix transcriptional regulator [Alphaproteobacteria bacterium]